MSKKYRFAKFVEPRSCDVCGSILGQVLEESEEGEGLGIVHECFCPSPYCAAGEERPPDLDPSFFYRTRVLVFTVSNDAVIEQAERDAANGPGPARPTGAQRDEDPQRRTNECRGGEPLARREGQPREGGHGAHDEWVDVADIDALDGLGAETGCDPQREGQRARRDAGPRPERRAVVQRARPFATGRR